MKILVTGASRGIGQAILNKLISKGFEVIGTSTNMRFVEEKKGVEWVEVDFNNDASFEEFILSVRKLGTLNGIVNNVGINIIKPLGDIEDADAMKVLNVNLLRPIQICSKLSDQLADGGRIVNIASIWSVISKEKRALYSAAKSGLAGITRSMAIELGKRNILVNTVSPGFVMTDLTKDSLTKKEMDSLTEKIPLGRMAEPNEIGEFVSYLLSDQNTYLTGQNIVIDGGFSIG